MLLHDEQQHASGKANWTGRVVTEAECQALFQRTERQSSESTPGHQAGHPICLHCHFCLIPYIKWHTYILVDLGMF